jgi:hypothetical protein
MNPTPDNEDRSIRLERTRIDDHLQSAALSLPLGGLITLVYFAGFSRFGASKLPWKIAASATCIAVLTLVIHYLLNRRARRLIWEGIAAVFAILPIWLLVGSGWLFYFAFAPMPYWLRWSVLVPCGLGTVYWLRIVWRDYLGDVEKLHLVRRLYRFDEQRILYPGADSDMIVATLRQRNPVKWLPVWAISLTPLAGALALGSIEHTESPSGPHVVFLILSLLSFPMSLWILAYFGLRTVFFHVYLPLKLEVQSGKKVILAP